MKLVWGTTHFHNHFALDTSDVKKSVRHFFVRTHPLYRRPLGVAFSIRSKVQGRLGKLSPLTCVTPPWQWLAEALAPSHWAFSKSVVLTQNLSMLNISAGFWVFLFVLEHICSEPIREPCFIALNHIFTTTTVASVFFRWCSALSCGSE